MHDMSITFDMFQFSSAEMSSRLEHPSNMLLVSVTRETSHLSRAAISTRDSHPENISLVLAIFPTPNVTTAFRLTKSLYLPSMDVSPNKSSLINKISSRFSTSFQLVRLVPFVRIIKTLNSLNS